MKHLLCAIVLAAAALLPAATSAEAQTWFDQCGLIDTWFPQAGIGFDQQWHDAVYPVTILETSYYAGTAVDYGVCQQIQIQGAGRYAPHDHGTRPWDYMTAVCFGYPTAYSRIVSFVPNPIQDATLAAYLGYCTASGSTPALQFQQ